MRKRKATHSPHSSADLHEGNEKLRLKQEVGLISGVSLIAGTMIGSGIFMSPEWVLHHMGSPASSLLIWAACGLLAMFGALSYAELGTIIKESGGEYIYILRIFGSFPAFLFAYTSVILVRPAGLAAVSLSFAEYAVAPFYLGCSSPQVVIKCTAAACILLLTIINCLNVRLATSVMNVFTAAKLLALLVIVVGGLVLLAKGQTQSFQNSFQNTTAGIGAVGVAFYQGLWSYDGWNNLNYVTEELKKPEVSWVTGFYLLNPDANMFDSIYVSVKRDSQGIRASRKDCWAFLLVCSVFWAKTPMDLSRKDKNESLSKVTACLQENTVIPRCLEKQLLGSTWMLWGWSFVLAFRGSHCRHLDLCRRALTVIIDKRVLIPHIP